MSFPQIRNSLHAFIYIVYFPFDYVNRSFLETSHFLFPYIRGKQSISGGKRLTSELLIVYSFSDNEYILHRLYHFILAFVHLGIFSSHCIMIHVVFTLSFCKKKLLQPMSFFFRELSAFLFIRNLDPALLLGCTADFYDQGSILAGPVQLHVYTVNPQ